MKTMVISKLTPAETLLVRDGGQASMRELLKYTLMDLILKQVLKIEDVERQLNARDPVKVYRYVSTGETFRHYDCLRHELTFLAPFYENSDSRMLFKNCVRIGYENARTKRVLHQKVRGTTELRDAFSTSFLQTIFGGYDYTQKGLALKTQVDEELLQLENELPKLLASDKEKALAKMKLIGGNIFLLKTIDLGLLKEFDEAFPKELVEERGSSCSGCSTWATFESHHSGDGDSGDSGCSSGDSGCSGCGGGCGGD